MVRKACNNFGKYFREKVERKKAEIKIVCFLGLEL